MTRVSAILIAALIAAAPLSAAAQDRGGFRNDRGGQDRSEMRERRQMSVAEAQSIAQSRAGNAEFKGYLGMRGNSHVFRFEDNGRVFDVSVDAGG